MELEYYNLLLIIIFSPLINQLLFRNYTKKTRNEIISRVINNIFSPTRIATRYPNETPLINIHYFIYKKRRKKEYLEKFRDFSYETEPLPHNYSFEKCEINSEHIVMCKAFNERRVVYEVLLKNHNEFYDTSIQKLIDKNIKWVLACPIWTKKTTDKPCGVIVLFGSKLIVKSNETNKQRRLENMGIELTKIISDLILIK